jgi:ABC-type Fe3+ transport system permease subunit
MNTLARICFSLAVFLAVAGTVYGLTSHEPAGTTLLAVAAITFCFLGVVSRMVARREERPRPRSRGSRGPDDRPRVSRVAAVIIALGLIVTPWLLVLGAFAFALAAAGWLRDVATPGARRGPSRLIIARSSSSR